MFGMGPYYGFDYNSNYYNSLYNQGNYFNRVNNNNFQNYPMFNFRGSFGAYQNGMTSSISSGLFFYPQMSLDYQPNMYWQTNPYLNQTISTVPVNTPPAKKRKPRKTAKPTPINQQPNPDKNVDTPNPPVTNEASGDENGTNSKKVQYTVIAKNNKAQTETISGTATVTVDGTEITEFSVIDKTRNRNGNRYIFVKYNKDKDGDLSNDSFEIVEGTGLPENESLVINKNIYKVTAVKVDDKTNIATVTMETDSEPPAAILYPSDKPLIVNETPLSNNPTSGETNESQQFAGLATNSKIKTQDITGIVSNTKFENGVLTEFTLTDKTNDPQGVTYVFELNGGKYKIISGKDSKGNTVLKNNNLYEIVGEIGDKTVTYQDSIPRQLIKMRTFDPQAAAIITKSD